MRRSSISLSVAGLLVSITVLAVRADDPPKPGANGNPDNVPYIGKSDPKGNPVRLAKATGHVSNYSEDKVPPYTLPDPLVLANGERVTTPEVVGEAAPAGDPEVLPDRDLRPHSRQRAEGDLGGDRDRPEGPRRRGDHAARGRPDGRQAGRPEDDPDGLHAGEGRQAGARAAEHLLRLPGRARGRRRPGRSTPSPRSSAAAGPTPRSATATSSRTAPTAGPRGSSDSR